MFLSATEHCVRMLVADQSVASALRAVLAYQPGLASAQLDVRIEGQTIVLDGTVPSERDRQRLLDIVHDFTAIPIVCLISVRPVRTYPFPAGDVAN